MISYEINDSIVAAKQKLVDFENIDTTPYGFAVIQNGYSKLNWSSFYALNSEDSGVGTYGNSGYFTGITSGEQVAFNPYTATEASISLTTGTFTFDSVQMTSAWNLKETVKIVGYDEDGAVAYSTKVKITDKGPLDVDLNWSGLSKVTFFFNDNGTPDPDLQGTGNNVVFDDFIFSRIRGTTDAPAQKGVADGAFGMNAHHESISSVHHVADTAHPVNLHLA